MVAAVVAVFGVADWSLFNDNWCCTVAKNSTMAEVASPAPLPTWRDAGSNLIQLLLNLGVCLLGILHGNTLLLGALQISNKFIAVRASFKLRTGTVAGLIPVIVRGAETLLSG